MHSHLFRAILLIITMSSSNAILQIKIQAQAKTEKANTTNKIQYFYPGYSEILTGVANPSIIGNAKIPNENDGF